MNAEFQGEQDGGVVVLCSGMLQSSMDLQFTTEFRGEKQSVILDMSGITYINSCGFGALVEDSMDFKEEGLSLSITGLSDPIRKTINVLGAEQLLTFLD